MYSFIVIMILKNILADHNLVVMYRIYCNTAL